MGFFDESENEYEQELPKEGWHKATVESIDLKPTQSGGSYWNVRLALDSGQSFFNMFQWSHLTNAEFQKRVRSEFSNFAVACGVTKAETEDELVDGISGKELFIKIKHKPDNQGGKRAEVNDVANMQKQHRKKGQMSFELVTNSNQDEDTPF